jgi:predicted mannosyl-3-phosphoglycerate phosphatase (HAD superfamily)
LRQTSSVLYIAVDSLIPSHGAAVAGFAEFTAELDLLGVPVVWLTDRSRLQFDAPRRKLSHGHPFIAEGGCGVYLPEDYFHLRPDSAPRNKKSPVVRLGRFTCIPVAELPPAASNALDTLSRDTQVPVVNIRSLSPRELLQNSGLPLAEAELARQRDFDELFFFAGVSDAAIQAFLAEGRARNLQLRQNGVFWSLAVGASIQACIRELTKLFDRALRYHAETVAIATADSAEDLFPHCARRILLTTRKQTNAPSLPSQDIPLHSGTVWEQIVASLSPPK